MEEELTAPGGEPIGARPMLPFGTLMSGVSEDEDVDIFCALFVRLPMPSRACCTAEVSMPCSKHFW